VLDAVGIAETSEGDAQRLRVLRAIDKYDRLGRDGVEALLGAGRRDESGDFTEGAKLPPQGATAVLRLIEAGESDPREGPDVLQALLERMSVAQSERVRAILADWRAAGDVLARLLAPGQATFDPTIVRGLEYYTGPVFEAQLLRKDESGRDIAMGSIGGGGRYDDLVSRFRGSAIPATGFSVGVSRLTAALALADAARPAPGPIVVLPFAAEAIGDCFTLAATVRGALNYPAEVYLGGAGPKAQLKYADKRNAG
jgi:histidyl-tRNA synthetase